MSGSFSRAFYQDRELYKTITISALESPNVQENSSPVRGLATKSWVSERLRVRGAENPIYQARVLGEFPDQADDTLTPLSAIDRATERKPASSDPEEPLVLAVDVARFGSDSSVLLRSAGRWWRKFAAIGPWIP